MFFWRNINPVHCVCVSPNPPLCCSVCESPFVPSEGINFHVTGSLAILLGETHLVTNLSFYLVTNRCNQESLIINCTNTTCCLSWQVLESCFLSLTLTGSPELLSAIQKGCVWLIPKEWENNFGMRCICGWSCHNLFLHLYTEDFTQLTSLHIIINPMSCFYS